MEYKRILTVQDISCVGQCSMTVVLPILSACGIETCVLPSAVLSTHTGGFTDVAFRDLTEDIPTIRSHWQREGIMFDAIYTGYLGSIKQIDYVMDLFDAVLSPGGKIIVDPAMADHGKLYRGFDAAYAARMTELCRRADVILPNLTEACIMTNRPYVQAYDAAFIRQILTETALREEQAVVLTGIGYKPEQTGVVVWENGEMYHYAHRRLSKNFHGTGDIFAAAFTGAWLRGKSKQEAVKIAADFASACMENTLNDENHWYGTHFETVLPLLMDALRKE